MKQIVLIRILGLLLIMTLVFSGCTALDKSAHSGSSQSESPKITEASVQTPAPTAAPSAEPTPSSAPRRNSGSDQYARRCAYECTREYTDDQKEPHGRNGRTGRVRHVRRKERRRDPG